MLVVVAVMCTLNVPPAASDVGPQDSVCGAAALTEHRPGFDWLSIDQVTPVPEPAGSGSLTVTPLAVPVPLLFTPAANPSQSPAFTELASPVFMICIAPGLHIIFPS